MGQRGFTLNARWRFLLRCDHHDDYGVGIGVIASSQLNVRFGDDEIRQELNRSIPFTVYSSFLLPELAFAGRVNIVLFYERYGQLSIQAVHGNVDKIIPFAILSDAFYSQWLVALFLVTLMAAAMSANSGQFHAIGTSLSGIFLSRPCWWGRSVAETNIVTRIGIVFKIFATLIIGLLLPESIVAIATAFFFSLCGATFIPAYLFALYWKRGTKVGAKASILCGFSLSLLWMLFVHEQESKAIGLARNFFGSDSLLGHPWNMIDPQVIALPVSFIVFFVVSLFSEPVKTETIKNAFRHI